MAIEQLLGDCRLAVRNLRKKPGFTTVAVLTLALGIGANTAIFSVVESVLLRPLPFAHGDRLVHLGYRPAASGAGNVSFSVLELQDYRRDSRTLADLAEYHQMVFSLLGRGEPDQVRVGVVSANFFDELGVQPILGRGLRGEDDHPGAPPVIVLTHDYWRRRFGGDPAIVGQALRMNDRAIMVVGVLPPLPGFPGNDDVFISLNACPFRSGERALHHREVRISDVFALLRPGATATQAEADVAVIARRLHREYPAAYRRDPDARVPVVTVYDELTQGFRPTLLVLLAAVGMVLLIACANLANLTIARLMSRQREVVVRAALGASRGRLVRQLLTESTLLALAGGACGLLLARASMPLLAAFANRFTALASEVHADGWVLLFTLGVSLLTGLAFGSLPALQLTRHDLAGGLKDGGGHATVGAGGNRARRLLVVAQVAVSVVLLIGAGLALRSLLELRKVEPGIDPANVLTMSIQLPFTKYSQPEKVSAFFDQLTERLAARHGVVAAALSSDNPIQDGQLNPNFKIEGRPVDPQEQEPRTSFHVVSPDYFRALGVPLLAGRAFDAKDRGDFNLVAVINRSLARQYFPGQSPLGRRIALTTFGQGQWRTIVGVVGDVKQHGLQADAGPGLYYPHAQAPFGRVVLMVRTAGDPLRIFGEVRSLVRALDPEQPIAQVQTLEQVRSDALAPSRLTATLLLLAAALAFVITATGVSGVTAFFVTERTQEIAIRSALGARQADVLGLVLRQGMSLAAIGMGLGTVAAWFLTRVLRSLLFGVGPTDPATFALVAVALLGVVAVAALLPALRAARIDPVRALRG